MSLSGGRVVLACFREEEEEEEEEDAVSSAAKAEQDSAVSWKVEKGSFWSSPPGRSSAEWWKRLNWPVRVSDMPTRCCCVGGAAAAEEEEGGGAMSKSRKKRTPTLIWYQKRW